MHHANLLVGDVDALLGKVTEGSNKNVDTLVLRFEKMGINDVLDIRSRATNRSIGDEGRSIVVGVTSMTHEAQNALLKILEDPPPLVQFHIVVPREHMLLPTLRSRLQKGEEAERQAISDEADTFIKSDAKDRLASIATHMKEKDDAWAEGILQGVEVYAEERGGKELLEDVVFVRRYFHTRGASKKMLLEHLALSLSK